MSTILPIHFDIRSIGLKPAQGWFFTVLWTHCDHLLRCFPKTQTLAEETDVSEPTVIKYIKWLVEHKAIVKVPTNLRKTNREKMLHHKQWVYQLTGIIEIDGDVHPTIYLGSNPKIWGTHLSLLDELNFDISLLYNYAKSSLSEKSILKIFKDNPNLILKNFKDRNGFILKSFKFHKEVVPLGTGPVKTLLSNIQQLQPIPQCFIGQARSKIKTLRLHEIRSHLQGKIDAANSGDTNPPPNSAPPPSASGRVVNFKDVKDHWDATTQTWVTDHYVYVGRSNPRYGLLDKGWGNPFVVGKDGNRQQIVAKYRQWLENQPALIQRLPELKGKTLVCFCHPEACHADVLLEFTQTPPAKPRKNDAVYDAIAQVFKLHGFQNNNVRVLIAGGTVKSPKVKASMWYKLRVGPLTAEQILKFGVWYQKNYGKRDEMIGKAEKIQSKVLEWLAEQQPDDEPIRETSLGTIEQDIGMLSDNPNFVLYCDVLNYTLDKPKLREQFVHAFRFDRLDPFVNQVAPQLGG